MIIYKANEKIKQYIKDSENLSFSVAAYHDGNLEKADFLTDKDTRYYEAGSITKTFTCIILINELGKNSLSVDISIDKILNLPAGYYPTVKQLLTHTAGYGNLVKCDSDDNLLYLEKDIPFSFSDNPFNGVSREDLIHAVTVFAGNKHPEYTSEYSNFGLSVAGLLIEKLTGKTYSQNLRDFASENGIKNIYAGKPDNIRVVYGYHDGENCHNWLWDKSAMLPCGGIYTDTAGLISYGRFILNSKDKYPRIFTDYCESFEPGNMQGLAFIHNPDGDIWWHNGGTGCFKTFFGVNFNKNAVAVTMSNQKARNGMTPEEIGFEILRDI